MILDTQIKAIYRLQEYGSIFPIVVFLKPKSVYALWKSLQQAADADDQGEVIDKSTAHALYDATMDTEEEFDPIFTTVIETGVSLAKTVRQVSNVVSKLADTPFWGRVPRKLPLTPPARTNCETKKKKLPALPSRNTDLNNRSSGDVSISPPQKPIRSKRALDVSKDRESSNLKQQVVGPSSSHGRAVTVQSGTTSVPCEVAVDKANFSPEQKPLQHNIAFPTIPTHPENQDQQRSSNISVHMSAQDDPNIDKDVLNDFPRKSSLNKKEESLCHQPEPIPAIDLCGDSPERSKMRKRREKRNADLCKQNLRHIAPVTIVVERNAQGSFGFSVAGGIEDDLLPVVVLRPNVFPIVVSGELLSKGDEIVAVNGVSVAGSTHDRMIELIKSAGQRVTLSVLKRRPHSMHKKVFSEAQQIKIGGLKILQTIFMICNFFFGGGG